MFDVIIPAYNCAATIGRTLSSLASQADPDFKITIVDDCSTEDIYSIIKTFSSLNITYIRNEKNMGCGMSRQVGIDNTTCEYFTFLDSDDMFMPYTSLVFNERLKEGCDMYYSTIIVQNSEKLKLYVEYPTWCHGKLYKRELIKKYNIVNTPEIKWADDVYFNSIYFELSDTIGHIEMPLHFFSHNPNSVMRCKNEERDKLQILDFLKGMVLSCRVVSKYKNKIEHIETTVESIKKLLLREEMTEEKEILFKELLTYRSKNLNEN